MSTQGLIGGDFGKINGQISFGEGSNGQAYPKLGGISGRNFHIGSIKKPVTVRLFRSKAENSHDISVAASLPVEFGSKVLQLDAASRTFLQEKFPKQMELNTPYLVEGDDVSLRGKIKASQIIFGNGERPYAHESKNNNSRPPHIEITWFEGWEEDADGNPIKTRNPITGKMYQKCVTRPVRDAEELESLIHLETQACIDGSLGSTYDMKTGCGYVMYIQKLMLFPPRQGFEDDEEEEEECVPPPFKETRASDPLPKEEIQGVTTASVSTEGATAALVSAEGDLDANLARLAGTKRVADVAADADETAKQTVEEQHLVISDDEEDALARSSSSKRRRRGA